MNGIRWFRDSLLNLYDDYAALSVEIKARAADDEVDEGDNGEEEEEEDGELTQSRNRAVSTFKTTL